ncbi:MAG: VWA domain-containing protein [Byssovorax sp.]
MHTRGLLLASSLFAFLALAACGPMPEANLGPDSPPEGHVQGERFVAGSAAPVPFPRPAAPPVEAPASWISAAPARTLIVPGDGQPVWIGVWIDAPNVTRKAARPPLSLALVVDTSGSMAGPKIENARLAAQSLLEGLSAGDLVSIDTFSDEVRTLAPPTLVDPSAMGPLFTAVRSLQSGGGTNLHDGLLAGEAHAASSASHALRRVIMISDGQANVGPSTPEALGDVASRGTETGVQVSAIGVGLDYDERTLGELARRTSGRLYHLEHPSELAAILDQEVRLLADTVATGVSVEITPGDGVELVGAEMADARREGRALRVPIGALYAGQRRELLVQARVTGAKGSAIEIGKARLVYQSGGERDAWAAQSAPITASIGDDRARSIASRDPRVTALLARHEAAEAQRRAAALLNEGKQQEAVDMLGSAEVMVAAAARSSGAGTTEFNKLDEQARRIAQSKKDAAAASTQEAARKRALESYSYSFSDDGLAAPSAPSKK